jgi:transcriptional regulator with XRE-family HTH domain
MLGARLKSIRKAKGLTQADLAKAIRVSQGYLSRIEKGEMPNAELLYKICSILEVSEAHLLYGAPNTPADQNQPLSGAESVKADFDAPSGLRDFVHDHVLCSTLNVSDAEWQALRSLDLPCPIKKDGYLQLLVTIRAVCRT